MNCGRLPMTVTMRKMLSPASGQSCIFAARAAGRVSGGATRVATAATGAVRHVAWYATYLIDGRRGTRD